MTEMNARCKRLIPFQAFDDFVSQRRMERTDAALGLLLLMHQEDVAAEVLSWRDTDNQYPNRSTDNVL